MLYIFVPNELHYILDPKEVHGEDFSGETFRMLKEKEIRQFGEYRTRRLVLEVWDEFGFPRRRPVRVVEEKEVRLYGEYPTRRFVLESWDGQGQG